MCGPHCPLYSNNGGIVFFFYFIYSHFFIRLYTLSFSLTMETFKPATAVKKGLYSPWCWVPTRAMLQFAMFAVAPQRVRTALFYSKWKLFRAGNSLWFQIYLNALFHYGIKSSIVFFNCFSFVFPIWIVRFYISLFPTCNIIFVRVVLILNFNTEQWRAPHIGRKTVPTWRFPLKIYKHEIWGFFMS